MQRPYLITVTGPSGVGKDTLAIEMLKRCPECTFSISATTRAPRPGEIHGRDFYFLGIDEFLMRMAQGQFLEYVHQWGDWYGTLRSEVERTFSQKKMLVAVVEVKGAAIIKARVPEAFSIFIVPPGATLEEQMAVLRGRLTGRKTERMPVAQRRLARAPEELAQQHQFDRIIVNDDFDRAVQELTACVRDAIGIGAAGG